MVDINEWHKIGNHLTGVLGICNCQRKLKTIVDSLVDIYENLKLDRDKQRPFTGAELLVIAFLDSLPGVTSPVEHGINIEYPILMENHPFWEWLLAVKDNPNLEDN